MICILELRAENNEVVLRYSAVQHYESPIPVCGYIEGEQIILSHGLADMKASVLGNGFLSEYTRIFLFVEIDNSEHPIIHRYQEISVPRWGGDKLAEKEEGPSRGSSIYEI